MRIGIFADSHDHLDNLRKVVVEFNRQGCQCALFAGDLVSTFAVPPLRKLACPLVACFGDNEGNKSGLQAGMGFFGSCLAEAPFSYRSADGTRFLIAHMERQLRGADGDYEVIVHAHTHKPSVSRDPRGRLIVNPGETSGWTYGDPTAAILETETMEVAIIHLNELSPVSKQELAAMSESGS